jgi:NAD(P)-dependent dehydrogenase (short-subunit alcohol dehydrogenase family)
MTVFGAKSTTEDVLAGVDLSGKRVLVTGVSAGLGVETARALGGHGAQVVGTARDLAKAERALRKAGAENVELVELDLADLKSVRAAADHLNAEGRKFDLVIANAGVMRTPFGHTVDGFETQFGTNHLGHFVFVNRIAPLIADGGRLVNLSSAGHRYSDVDLDDPNFECTPYDPMAAYGRSKTANILFAVEFDRRHKGRGVRSTAVHPGGIRTELDRHMKPGELDEWVAKIDADLANRGEPPLEFKSVPQGAATSVWAGVVATGDEIGGSYCADCHVVTNVTDREISVLSDGVRPYALDPERAKALWAKSEKMVGERFGRSRAGPIQAQLPRRRSESGGSDEPQNYRLPGLSE